MNDPIVIKHIEPPYRARRDNCQPYGQGVMGYGSKIATTMLILLPGEKRWRRVYCCIFGNSGSLYVVRNNEDYYLRDGELSEALERGE